MGAGVFAGTTIDPSALVQRLDLDARSVASIRRGEGRRGGPRVGACGLVLSLLPRARGLGRAEVRTQCWVLLQRAPRLGASPVRVSQGAWRKDAPTPEGHCHLSRRVLILPSGLKARVDLVTAASSSDQGEQAPRCCPSRVLSRGSGLFSDRAPRLGLCWCVSPSG